MLVPKSFLNSVHPSGMSAWSYKRADEVLDKHGFQRVGYRDTREGRILVAERRYLVPNSHWKVLWFARDFAQELECSLESTRDKRFEAAVAAAVRFLEQRKAVMQ